MMNLFNHWKIVHRHVEQTSCICKVLVQFFKSKISAILIPSLELVNAFSSLSNYVYATLVFNKTIILDTETPKYLTSDLQYHPDSLMIALLGSSVARAFPGGRVAHSEGQNEEENENILRKNKSN